MNTLFRRALFAGSMLALLAGRARAEPSGDLVKIMERYAAALAANDVEALVSLYSPQGVFMREEMKAVVGHDALRATYREVFATLKVNLQFTVREAEEAGDMAWLRSVSKGTVKLLKTGVESKQGYNQLVVFRKENGTWKIRAYLYGSNRPEPGQTPS
jgi:uncharacterized protein (TIGR02246 family)